MTEKELRTIIENHQHWVNEDCDGWTTMRADLRGADLRGAYLKDANLCGADLRGAELSNADLRGANLRLADLKHANLRGANIISANLVHADFRGATNVPYIPMICPEKGGFFGYKKCEDNVIVKLYIPSSSKRSSATSRKCRTNRAFVVSISNNLKETYSMYDPIFVYKLHTWVEVLDFDDDRWDECSTGIHFFMNEQEAIDYDF